VTATESTKLAHTEANFFLWRTMDGLWRSDACSSAADRSLRTDDSKTVNLEEFGQKGFRIPCARKIPTLAHPVAQAHENAILQYTTRSILITLLLYLTHDDY
jgi:hypothetical protein